MIKPAKRKNLYQEVSQQIIGFIKEGIWVQGERIPSESELSKSFEISRNSMREAIKALELTGVLSSKSGTGTFVAEFALQNISKLELVNDIQNNYNVLELMETRLMIEPELIYKAIEVASEEDIRKLDNVLDEVNNYIEKNGYTVDVGLSFHMEIAKISGNKILYNFIQSLKNQLIAQRGDFILKHIDEELLDSELREHGEMLECFKKKNPQEGYDLMKKHLKNSIESIKLIE
ncbi:FadR/GntR family transcriptional regulator [Clostridiaceae bacterium HSG29]|nr:FadR/GntR family transcriptional regulator [Clostridiaceae bacterium HSG29]